MKTFTLQSQHKKILADTLTPVSAYLKIRDVFPHSLLLESSDYHANNKNFSYICCNPIASIELKNKQLSIQYPNGECTSETLKADTNIPERIYQFSQQFESEDYPFKFISNGIFGYIAHDAVAHFENLELNQEKVNKHNRKPQKYWNKINQLINNPDDIEQKKETISSLFRLQGK